jgi:hypothetical protein
MNPKEPRGRVTSELSVDVCKKPTAHLYPSFAEHRESSQTVEKKRIRDGVSQHEMQACEDMTVSQPSVALVLN